MRRLFGLIAVALALPASAATAPGLKTEVYQPVAMPPGVHVEKTELDGAVFADANGTCSVGDEADNAPRPDGGPGGAVGVAAASAFSNAGLRRSAPRGPGICDTGTHGPSAPRV